MAVVFGVIGHFDLVGSLIGNLMQVPSSQVFNLQLNASSLPGKIQPGMIVLSLLYFCCFDLSSGMSTNLCFSCSKWDFCWTYHAKINFSQFICIQYILKEQHYPNLHDAR